MCLCPHFFSRLHRHIRHSSRCAPSGAREYHWSQDSTTARFRRRNWTRDNNQSTSDRANTWITSCVAAEEQFVVKAPASSTRPVVCFTLPFQCASQTASAHAPLSICVFRSSDQVASAIRSKCDTRPMLRVNAVRQREFLPTVHYLPGGKGFHGIGLGKDIHQIHRKHIVKPPSMPLFSMEFEGVNASYCFLAESLGGKELSSTPATVESWTIFF